MTFNSIIGERIALLAGEGLEPREAAQEDRSCLFDPSLAVLGPWPRFCRLFSRERLSMLWVLARARLMTAEESGSTGLVWFALGPLLTWAVMYLVFCWKFGRDVRSYSLYLLAAVICADFMIGTISKINSALVRERELIVNTRMPREIVVLAEAGQPIFKLVGGLVLCSALSLSLGEASWRLVALPFLAGAFIVFALAVSLALAALSCFVVDVNRLWSFFGRILLLTSPVFFSAEHFSAPVAAALHLINPLALFMQLMRSALMASQPSVPELALYCAALTAFSGIAGWRVFCTLEMQGVERI